MYFHDFFSNIKVTCFFSNPRFYIYIRLVVAGDVEKNPGPTNREIMQWYRMEEDSSEISIIQQNAWSKYAAHFSCDIELCKPVSFSNKLSRLRKSLVKLRSKQKEEILSPEFELPKIRSDIEVLCRQKNNLEAENKCLKCKLGYQAEIEFDFVARLKEMKSLRISF